MDWPAIAPAVCRRLLGEPNRRLSNTRELRWGRKGSLRLDLESGRLFDFEADMSLGLLDLVAREYGLADRKAARQWLEQQGFVHPNKGVRNREHRPLRREHPRPDPLHEPTRRPFHEIDLPRLDFGPIPDHPEHPLNRWAFLKCGRPDGAPWPDSCRWLRGWKDGGRAWGGDAILAPLAKPEAWLADGGLPRTAVKGIHAVFVSGDGRPRQLPDGRNKTDWNNKRTGSTVGCGFLVGRPASDSRLALCEGLADALAIHWHLGVSALAACGSLAGLAWAAGELAHLTRFPVHARLEIWPDRDIKANPKTGLQAGPTGVLVLCQALRAAGVQDDRIAIMDFGRPGQDPCDWLAERHRTRHAGEAPP